MPIPNRHASMLDSLQALRHFSVPIRSVLDVGVNQGSPSLTAAFPDLEHWLFEPVSGFQEAIARHYAAIRHQLFPVALSNVDGEAYQVSLAMDGGGAATHSQLVTHLGEWEHDPRVRHVESIQRRKLDTVLADHALESPHLLKVDVDGVELDVLRGGTETLRRCSVVVVEAPHSQILERLRFVTEAGFDLFDIVDSCYYGGVLWQVDLIFVARSIMQENPEMRPMSKPPFDPAQWWSVPDHAIFEGR
jgi:FkbM family methyltransferase